MIKNIFFPEKIGSYYLFSQRTVGITMSSTHIYATVALAQGENRIIEKLIDEPIPSSTTVPYEERAILALKALGPKLGTYDTISCVLPSSQIIFKELNLPFTGLKKIKMVVPFEVEPLLPFSLDQATIDSIITREDKQAQQTDVLVAAAKNDLIEQYTHYFDAAGLPLDKLSVDMFELYSLYRSIASNADVQQTSALIDLEKQETRIVVIINGQLKYIRALAKGITEGTPKNILEELASEIALSIESYTQKLKAEKLIQKIVLTGASADTPGLIDALGKQLKADVQLFQPKQLMHNSHIQSKITTLPQSFMVSIATALSTPPAQEFNLYRQAVEEKENRRIAFQLITLASLTVLIFLTFSLYSVLRIRNLRLAYREAESEALQELKKSFRLKPAQSVNLEAANRAAANELKRQETTWRRLSPENRYAFLKYLTELSRCINVKEAQLELTSIAMKEDTIKLYGRVPGYQQLTKLQNQLACPLFKKVPKLQDLNFKADPITLTINREAL